MHQFVDHCATTGAQTKRRRLTQSECDTRVPAHNSGRPSSTKHSALTPPARVAAACRPPTTPPVCEIGLDRSTRQVLVRGAPSLVRRVDPAVGCASAPCHRIPLARFPSLVFEASTTVPPTLLQFRGAGSQVLSSTAARLRRTAAEIRLVLSSPHTWPVLMTRGGKGSAGERSLLVSCYSQVHQMLLGQSVDLVRHRSVALLLEALPNVITELTADKGMVCRLAATPQQDDPMPVVTSVPQQPQSRQPWSSQRGLKRPRASASAGFTTSPSPPGVGVVHTPPPMCHQGPLPRPPRVWQPSPESRPRSMETLVEHQDRLLAAAAMSMLPRHLGVVGLRKGHWRSTNPLDVLGLAHVQTSELTPKLLRRRFHCLALLLHPDKAVPNNDSTPEVFAAVSSAYERLRVVVSKRVAAPSQS